MFTNELSTMSPAQLSELMESAKRLREKKLSEGRADMRRRLIALATSEGYEVEDLFGIPRTGRGMVSAEVRAAKAKYRNPENPSQHWTGRGKRPAWFKNALAAGVSLDALRV